MPLLQITKSTCLYISCSHYILTEVTNGKNVNIRCQVEDFDWIIVRHYKPKTKKGLYDGTLMQRAVEDVRNGKSLRSVARDLKLNRTTLGRYVRRMDGMDLEDITGEDCRYRRIFTSAEEILLRNYLLKLMFYRLKYNQTRILAYVYATTLNKNLPPNWERDGMAGKDWMICFMRRHQKNISLRESEPTSISRALCSNETAVGEFFKLLKDDMSIKPLDPVSEDLVPTADEVWSSSQPSPGPSCSIGSLLRPCLPTKVPTTPVNSTSSLERLCLSFPEAIGPLSWIMYKIKTAKMRKLGKALVLALTTEKKKIQVNKSPPKSNDVNNQSAKPTKRRAIHFDDDSGVELEANMEN